MWYKHSKLYQYSLEESVLTKYGKDCHEIRLVLSRILTIHINKDRLSKLVKISEMICGLVQMTVTLEKVIA